jgi:hypothetical protein
MVVDDDEDDDVDDKELAKEPKKVCDQITQKMQYLPE